VNRVSLGIVGIGTQENPPIIRVIPPAAPRTFDAQGTDTPPSYRDCCGYGASGQVGAPPNPCPYGSGSFNPVFTPPFSPPLPMTVTTSGVGLGGCAPSTFVVPDAVYKIPWAGSDSVGSGCYGTYTDVSGFTIYAGLNTNFFPVQCVVIITDPDGNTIFGVAGDSPTGIGDTLTNGIPDGSYPSGVCPGTTVLDV
jgi:hypothetical protein